MVGRLAALVATLALAPTAGAVSSYPGTPWITEGADGTVWIGHPPAGSWPWDPGMGSEPVAFRIQPL